MGSAESSKNSRPTIYHEKQVKELCALHCLNNLFQSSTTFSKCDLDSICALLSPNHWVNPHKSMLGTGNYDINVIMAALQSKGCDVQWFDKRKDPGTIALTLVLGFIMNIPSEYRLGPVQLPLRRKHWVAVRWINGAFYNLDSKLDEPYCIGQESDLLTWLREELCCKDKELFIVTINSSNSAVQCNGEYNSEDLLMNLSSKALIEQGRALLEDVTNVYGELDKTLQNKLLARDEEDGECFSSPGLKYIDSDAQSFENATAESTVPKQLNESSLNAPNCKNVESDLIVNEESLSDDNLQKCTSLQSRYQFLDPHTNSDR